MSDNFTVFIRKIIQPDEDGLSCAELMQTGKNEESASESIGKKVGQMEDDDSPRSIVKNLERKLEENQRMRIAQNNQSDATHLVARQIKRQGFDKVDNFESGSGKADAVVHEDLVAKNEKTRKWEKARKALIAVLQTTLYEYHMEEVVLVVQKGKDNFHFEQSEGVELLVVKNIIPSEEKIKIIELEKIEEGHGGSDNLIFHILMADGGRIKAKVDINQTT